MLATNIIWDDEVIDTATHIQFPYFALKRFIDYIDLSKQFIPQDSLSVEQLKKKLLKTISNKSEAIILGDANGTITQQQIFTL